MLDFSAIRTVLFDVDGVLYRGGVALPGVREIFAFCAQRDIAYACITNNGSMPPQQYEQKLAAMGIQVNAAHILTSALATFHYLRATYPRGTTVYAIGMHGLHEALFDDGYLISDERQPRVVVLGPDFEVTYDKLKIGCLAIRAGADYVLTNPDKTIPIAEGFVPDAGALSAALEASTGITPVVVGKPEPLMFRTALERLGGTANTAMVIGDRLETDIAGAHNAGLYSALVLTGASQQEDLATSPYQPDAVFADLPALLSAWQEATTL